MTAETDHEAAEDEAIAIDADGEITLPVIDVLTGRAFLTGKSGSGKSKINAGCRYASSYF